MFRDYVSKLYCGAIFRDYVLEHILELIFERYLERYYGYCRYIKMRIFNRINSPI